MAVEPPPPPLDRTAAILGVVGGVLFLALAAFLTANPYPTRVDDAYASFIDRLNSEGRFRWADSADEVLIDYIAWMLVDAALVISLWRWASPRTAVAAGVAVAGQWFVVRVMKALIDRPRPPGAFSTSGGYPSGHVANASLTLLLALYLLLPVLRARGLVREGARRDAAFVASLVVTYAFYRAFTGEHWITDVLGAVALAAAWSAATLVVLARVPAGR